MRLRCLISKGFLDISSQEPYQGEIPEMIPFRLTMRPGQVVEIQDEYRNLRNIDSAIRSGLLEVLNYNQSDGSIVVNAELKKPYNPMVLNDISDVDADSPSNNQSLIFNVSTNTWVPGAGQGSGGHKIYELLMFNISPVESPDGTNKTFTLPNNEQYISNKIAVYINGQSLNLEDFQEDLDRMSITLKSSVPAPNINDIIGFHYVKEDTIAFDDISEFLSTSLPLNSLMSFNVVPDGEINGANKTFTIPSNEQYVSDKIEVYLNGNVLSDEDYIQNVGNTSITLKSSVPAPVNGDKIRINYIKIPNPYNFLVFHDEPVEVPDGQNKIFSINQNSYEKGKIQVTLNGQVLTEDDVSESITGRQIIFKYSPSIGDNIRFYYMSGTFGLNPKEENEINYIPSNLESSGTKITLISNDLQHFGDICFINSSGKSQIANASTISTASAIVMCIDTQAHPNASANYLLNGIARNDSWSFSVGGLVFLSTSGTTGNTITQIAPSGEDNAVQVLGVATESNRMLFNPSLVQVEHA